MRLLQRVILPALDLTREIDLYVRLSGRATLDVAAREVRFGAGGGLRTDTYFGAFSVTTWTADTSVRQLTAALDVTGRFRVDVVLTTLDGHEQVLDSHVVDGGPVARLVLPDLGTLDAGLLWFRLGCQSDEGIVRGIELRTDDPPVRDVHLGVVITTFRREAYVAASVGRLERLFAEHPGLASTVSVLIVDNASSLELDGTTGDLPLEIVRNPNLGGAGGFARGLWELRRAGRATHVLVMDDDVAFEPDLVARASALLASTTDPSLCLAGSMLRMDQPPVQFEAGANCDPSARTLWQPIGRGRNLRYVDALLANERSGRFDYGAWWFLACPLSITEAYPPPFFVRGDDVFWGIRHTAGRAITVNGLGVWHADFDPKNGPPSAFYESRNLAVIKALAYPEHTRGELRRRLLGVALRVFAFRYDWAEATLDGIEAFLDGPQAMMSADPAAVHSRLAAAYRSERLRALSDEELEIPLQRRTSKAVTVVSGAVAVATAGGNLVPRALRRGRPLAVPLQSRPLSAPVLRDRLLYRYDASGEGFTAERDRTRALALLRRTWRVARRVRRECDAAADAFRAAEPEMTSAEFWEAKFTGRAGP